MINEKEINRINKRNSKTKIIGAVILLILIALLGTFITLKISEDGGEGGASSSPNSLQEAESLSTIHGVQVRLSFNDVCSAHLKTKTSNTTQECYEWVRKQFPIEKQSKLSSKTEDPYPQNITKKRSSEKLNKKLRRLNDIFDKFEKETK